jgi:hypothetical protein
MIDVRGIGAVLFEATTGEPAFDDPAAAALDDLDGATPLRGRRLALQEELRAVRVGRRADGRALRRERVSTAHHDRLAGTVRPCRRRGGRRRDVDALAFGTDVEN